VRYYRPVFSVWLLLVNTLGGVAPFAWHLATVMLHVAVTYLVFKIALELLERPIAASAAACLFAIHPIHIEDVCWISAANELIYAGFALCSLLFLFYGNRRARPAYIWLSLAAWSAALFAKETATALLPLFVVLAYFGWPRSGKRNPTTALAFVAVAAVYLVVRWIVLKDLLFKTDASWNQTLLKEPVAIEFYVYKLIIPTHLSPAYYLPTIQTSRFWSHAVAIAFIIVLIAYLSRRRPALAISVALLLLPLFPALVGIHYFVDFHERYLYLPSVGFVLLFGLAVEYLWSRSQNATVSLGLLLAAACIALNLSQQSPYQNENAFRTRTLIATRIIQIGFTESEWQADERNIINKDAVTYCWEGAPEAARALLNLPPSIVAFYRLSSRTLFLATSFDMGSDPMTYVTPEGVRGNAPLDDLELRVTACLNPELLGTLPARGPAPAITAQ
jgi:hypothetical protein